MIQLIGETMKHRWIAALACLAVVSTGFSGCGKSETTSVSVQSVAMICGFTVLTQSQQFTGVVSTGKEQSITRDSDKRISKVYVQVGDQVKEGDKLFTYDSEQAQNSLERAKLELEEQKNAQDSKQNEKKQLEAAQKKAKQSEQMDYILKIQEVETDIRENAYNMALKEKEIQRLEDSMKNLDVTAPISGRIDKAGTADASTGIGTAFGDGDDDLGGYDSFDDGSDSDGSDSAFIKIVENDNFRIKGTINEQNISDIQTGVDMIIYSRVDDSLTWRGTVTEVDMKNPEKDSEEGYYYGGNTDEMTTSSKYPFYVSIDSLDGLMIGQHVYMRADTGEFEDENEIRLDASFINDADTEPWIWAESESGLLEQRAVSVDEFDETSNTYLVTDGITADDYIAPSSSAYEVGMPCIENNNTAFESSDDAGGEYEEGMDDEYEGDIYGDDEYMLDDEEVYDDFAYEDEEYFDEENFDDEGAFDEEVYDEEVYDGGEEVGGFNTGNFGGFGGGPVG